MDDHRAGHQVDAGAAGLQAANKYAAVWGLVSHQQRPNMLLLTPTRHSTLSALIFCLIHSLKANSYPFP
jgi:hypothetical protein